MKFMQSALMTAAVLATSGLVSTADAGVSRRAFGDQMAGGTVTVSFQALVGGQCVDAGTMQAPIMGLFGNTADAMAPGFFHFRMVGETYTNIWELDNISPDLYIKEAIIDLTGSISLFDDDTQPSTPGSARGRAGVSYIAASSAPMEIFSGEFGLWADQCNTGDEYLKEQILWNDCVFAPGQAYLWNDDTDYIPAPATLALVGLGGLCAARRRRG